MPNKQLASTKVLPISISSQTNVFDAAWGCIFRTMGSVPGTRIIDYCRSLVDEEGNMIYPVAPSPLSQFGKSAHPDPKKRDLPSNPRTMTLQAYLLGLYHHDRSLAMMYFLQTFRLLETLHAYHEGRAPEEYYVERLHEMLDMGHSTISGLLVEEFEALGYDPETQGGVANFVSHCFDVTGIQIEADDVISLLEGGKAPQMVFAVLSQVLKKREFNSSQLIMLGRVNDQVLE